MNLIKFYENEINRLTTNLWTNSKVYKETNANLPKWLKDIMRQIVGGMYTITAQVKYPWVIFPEYIPNYSLLVFKKEEDFIKKIKKIQMRHLEAVNAEKSAEFAKKATSIYKKQVLKQDKQIIKLEDNYFLMFSFPTEMMRSVLIALGAENEDV